MVLSLIFKYRVYIAFYGIINMTLLQSLKTV